VTGVGLVVFYDFCYRGDVNSLIKKLEKIRSLALRMRAKPSEVHYYQNLFNSDEVQGNVERMKLLELLRSRVCFGSRRGWKGVVTIRGGEDVVGAVALSVDVIEGCEWFNVIMWTFDGKHWIGSDSTKTSHAPRFWRAHLMVLRLLEECRKLGILERVLDEAECWRESKGKITIKVPTEAMKIKEELWSL
jgi:hypothetical protein